MTMTTDDAQKDATLESSYHFTEAPDHGGAATLTKEDNNDDKATNLLTSQIKKQGHKYCGGCCDMRRAVIIVNMVNILLLGLDFMCYHYLNSVNDNADMLDDDKIVAQLADVTDGHGTGFYLQLAGGIVISICGIVGADSYRMLLVFLACLEFCAGIVLNLFVYYNSYGLVYNALFAYPHFFLMSELHNGIMSKETYHIEKQSCCCV